jgi:virulence factor Mce-like protein
MHRGRGGLGKHALVVGAFTLVVLAWVVYILIQAGTIPTLGKKYTITATLPTANLLAPGARVTAAGAEVGSVKAVEAAKHDPAKVQVELELTDDRVFPLPDDSRITVRTRSQVGENYVEIQVGTSKRTVADHGSLGLDSANEFVSVDEILSVLQGDTRERARTMFQQLGSALTGRGDELNRTLRGVEGTFGNGRQLTEILDADRENVAELVDHLGAVTAAIGDREAAVQTIATQGLTSLRAISDRNAALESILRKLPPTMATVRETTATLGRVSDSTAPVVDDLAQATEDLRPTLLALAPAANTGVGLVRQLDRSVPDIHTLTHTAAPLGDPVVPAIRALRSTLCQANPALRYIEPRKHDLAQALFHLGSASNAYDATGHVLRMAPVINENSLAGAPPPVLDATHTLLESGLFIPGKLLEWAPYEPTGAVGKNEAVAGGPATPTQLRERGFEYPRIKADC